MIRAGKRADVVKVQCQHQPLAADVADERIVGPRITHVAVELLAHLPRVALQTAPRTRPRRQIRLVWLEDGASRAHCVNPDGFAHYSGAVKGCTGYVRAPVAGSILG